MSKNCDKTQDAQFKLQLKEFDPFENCHAQQQGSKRQKLENGLCMIVENFATELQGKKGKIKQVGVSATAAKQIQNNQKSLQLTQNSLMKGSKSVLLSNSAGKQSNATLKPNYNFQGFAQKKNSQAQVPKFNMGNVMEQQKMPRNLTTVTGKTQVQLQKTNVEIKCLGNESSTTQLTPKQSQRTTDNGISTKLRFQQLQKTAKPVVTDKNKTLSKQTQLADQTLTQSSTKVSVSDQLEKKRKIVQIQSQPQLQSIVQTRNLKKRQVQVQEPTLKRQRQELDFNQQSIKKQKVSASKYQIFKIYEQGLKFDTEQLGGVTPFQRALKSPMFRQSPQIANLLRSGQRRTIQQQEQDNVMESKKVVLKKNVIEASDLQQVKGKISQRPMQFKDQKVQIQSQTGVQRKISQQIKPKPQPTIQSISLSKQQSLQDQLQQNHSALKVVGSQRPVSLPQKTSQTKLKQDQQKSKSPQIAQIKKSGTPLKVVDGRDIKNSQKQLEQGQRQLQTQFKSQTLQLELQQQQQQRTPPKLRQSKDQQLQKQVVITQPIQKDKITIQKQMRVQQQSTVNTFKQSKQVRTTSFPIQQQGLKHPQQQGQAKVQGQKQAQAVAGVIQKDKVATQSMQKQASNVVYDKEQAQSQKIVTAIKVQQGQKQSKQIQRQRGQEVALATNAQGQRNVQSLNFTKVPSQEQNQQTAAIALKRQQLQPKEISKQETPKVKSQKAYIPSLQSQECKQFAEVKVSSSQDSDMTTLQTRKQIGKQILAIPQLREPPCIPSTVPESGPKVEVDNSCPSLLNFYLERGVGGELTQNSRQQLLSLLQKGISKCVDQVDLYMNDRCIHICVDVKIIKTKKGMFALGVYSDDRRVAHTFNPDPVPKFCKSGYGDSHRWTASEGWALSFLSTYAVHQFKSLMLQWSEHVLQCGGKASTVMEKEEIPLLRIDKLKPTKLNTSFQRSSKQYISCESGSIFSHDHSPLYSLTDMDEMWLTRLNRHLYQFDNQQSDIQEIVPGAQKVSQKRIISEETVERLIDAFEYVCCALGVDHPFPFEAAYKLAQKCQWAPNHQITKEVYIRWIKLREANDNRPLIPQYNRPVKHECDVNQTYRHAFGFIEDTIKQTSNLGPEGSGTGSNKSQQQQQQQVNRNCGQCSVDEVEVEDRNSGSTLQSSNKSVRIRLKVQS
eukprot:TRINITY_DN40926_c0_g1_i5.p1 TRINITY_DN40926_c0_g1~~TRINITY_DN40926_c0_g1_i5.p1  ORF type:complete len:1173 (-),score=96.01 TRINITY_DN40926_c0_g1_i5:271-3789(-)